MKSTYITEYLADLNAPIMPVKAIPNLTTRRSHSLAWHAWQWLMRKIGGG